MKIKLSDIHPAENPVRTRWDDDKLEELKRSIKSEGLIVPIKVRPNEGGFEVVYGHRRLEALKQLGVDEVNAEIIVDTQVLVDEPDDDEAGWQALIENIDREDPDDLDVAQKIKDKKDKGYSIKEIASRLGWSKTYVNYFLALTRVPGPVKKALENGPRDSMAHFIKSGSLHKEPDLRGAVINKARTEGLTENQTEDVSKSIATTKDPKRRQALLETPYSSFIHDPDINKDRAERFGASDPTSISKTPSPAEVWETTPETKGVIDLIKIWRKRIKSIREGADSGKFAPEAKPFLARRIWELIDDLTNLAEYLEDES